MRVIPLVVVLVLGGVTVVLAAEQRAAPAGAVPVVRSSTPAQGSAVQDRIDAGWRHALDQICGESNPPLYWSEKQKACVEAAVMLREIQRQGGPGGPTQ